MRYTSFCMAGILLLCGSETTNPATLIEGVEWQLEKLGDREIAFTKDEKPVSLEFAAANKRATGYGGCNSFFGEYKLEGQSIKFGALGATQRSCGEALDNLEMYFFQALEETRIWRVAGGKLMLLDGGSVLAVFSRRD